MGTDSATAMHGFGDQIIISCLFNGSKQERVRNSTVLSHILGNRLVKAEQVSDLSVGAKDEASCLGLLNLAKTSPLGFVADLKSAVST